MESTIKDHQKKEVKRRLSGKTAQQSLYNFSCLEVKGRADWLEA